LLTDFLLGLMGFVLRLGLLLVGLLVMASLLGLALLLAAWWLLRALWARLTGQPVAPWTFQVNRQAVWQRFRPRPGDLAGSAAAPTEPNRQADDDVTDVEPKRITPR